MRWRSDSPVGVLDITAGELGVQRLTIGEPFRGTGEMPIITFPASPTPPLFAQVDRELAEFAAGDRFDFDLPVDLSGAELSDFQRHVLLTLRAEVPAGETVTYGELAEMAGRPGAARAVGTAMRKNPVQLLIPCHRVVAANGIGGYGGGPAGTALKRALLAREDPARPNG